MAGIGRRLKNNNRSVSSFDVKHFLHTSCDSSPMVSDSGDNNLTIGRAGWSTP